MLEAVIFDMDGLLIDSEPFWKIAEKEVFSSLGINVTEDLTLQTCRMTTKEVTTFWYSQKPWEHKTLYEVEQAVINKVAQLIEENGTMMPGVLTVLEYFKTKGYKIGLATNAPHSLIAMVLSKLGVESYFDAVSSAEFEQNGKPHPGVYLKTAMKLGVTPKKCLAFEDSISGVRAAIDAGMKVVAVPASEHYESETFKIADLKIKCLSDFCAENLTFLIEN